jgi:hypothetical protein
MSSRSSFIASRCLAACLPLLASCRGEPPENGPGPPASRDFEDGSRLAGLFVATTAGESQQIGILDRALGVTCAFVTSGDGRLRCLPAGTAVLGDRVDPAMFVAARAAGPRRTDGPVTTWQIEGEDGSRFQTGLYDTAAGKACTALRLDERQAICLGGPFASADPRAFADAACTRQVVTSFDGFGPGPAPTAFLDGQVARAVAGRWDGPLWQLSDTGACQAAERIQQASYYEAGEVLHPPRLTFAFEGQGRVKREVVRDERGQLLGATGPLVEGSGAGLLDSMNGAPCAPLFVPDGSFRCVSLSVGRIQAGQFADRGCQVPTVGLTIAKTFSPGGGGGPPGVVALLGDESGPWGKITGVHALGARTNTYYEGSPAACQGPVLTKADAIPLGATLLPPDFERLVTNRTR